MIVSRCSRNRYSVLTGFRLSHSGLVPMPRNCHFHSAFCPENRPNTIAICALENPIMLNKTMTMVKPATPARRATRMTAKIELAVR